MRYLSASIVPGGKRPSSIEEEDVQEEAEVGVGPPLPGPTVAAKEPEAISWPQRGQKRLAVGTSLEQDGQRVMRSPGKSADSPTPVHPGTSAGTAPSTPALARSGHATSVDVRPWELRRQASVAKSFILGFPRVHAQVGSFEILIPSHS